MNFEKVQRKNRKAISPVLATVILIAITLIAAIAIAGFVFGLFGSFTSTAQVSGEPIYMTAAIANAAAAAPTCPGVQPAAGASYILLHNTGSASATIGTVTFTFGGKTFVQNAPAGCTVAGGGFQYLVETGLGGGAAAVVGSQFTGSATLSNGGDVALSGSFY